MANELDVRKMETPLIWQGEPENASQHATWIAGRVQVLLSHYFQPDNPVEVKEAAIDDWINILSDFSEGAIDAACSKYLRNQPRRRPTPGDIRNYLMTDAKERADRKRYALPPPPDPPSPPRVTSGAAQRIMDEAGFTPDLSNALKRFPRAQTPKEAYERMADPVRHEMTYETDQERLRGARKAAGVL